MAKLKQLPTMRVLRALERAGWTPRPMRKGRSHYVLVNADRPGIVTVPRHREVRKGTLRQVIRAAGLTLNEFEELYR